MSDRRAADRPAAPRRSGGIQRCALILFSVLLTVVVEAALSPLPPLAIVLLISLLGVVLTAYFAGPNAALFVTASNLVIDWYFFAAPRYSFAVADAADRWRLAAFAVAGVVVCGLSYRLKGARRFSRVALLLSSALFLIIVAMLVSVDLENERAAEDWVQHTYQVLNASDELLAITEHAEEQQRDYLLTGDEQHVRAYLQTRSSVEAATGKLHFLTRDNAPQQLRIAAIQRLINAKLERLDQGISIRQKKGLSAAMQEVGPGAGAQLMDSLRASLTTIEAEEHGLLIQRTKAAAEQATRTRGALAFGTALLVALLIAAGTVIETDVKKLQDSARMLRRQSDLLDQAQSPIIVWQLGGAIEYWNQGAERIYGISSQEALGKGHNALLQPFHPFGMEAIEERLARDRQWTGELAHVIAGREVIVEADMTLVTESDGRQTVLKTTRDVTEERRAHAEIQRLNQELEQRVKDRTAQLEASNKELEAFAYSVSHDLRAPLRGIDGWSMALLEDYGGALDQTARQYLDRVRSESQRMGRLIDDLLTLSRLTRLQLQHESVDLTELAHSIAGRMREAEPKRNIDFVIQDGLRAAGDTHLLDIALSNLLSNAVKFTGPREVARIEFGQTNGDQERAFYVRDNGVGFDMAYADVLFSAFQRLHRSTEFPGTGIGLATAHRVIRRHGGKIWANAKPGEGAIFYFTIDADQG